MVDKKRWKRMMIHVFVWIVVIACAFYFAPAAH